MKIMAVVGHYEQNRTECIKTGIKTILWQLMYMRHMYKPIHIVDAQIKIYNVCKTKIKTVNQF